MSSSPTIPESAPGCETSSTPKFTLTFSNSTASPRIEISPAMLSTQLSDSAMARLGHIDDVSDEISRSSRPPDLSGRPILVFWCDKPTIYSAHQTASGCVFSPASSGATFSAIESPVLVDPRLLDPSRIDFATAVISPAQTPEATDGTTKTSHKQPGGAISHPKAAGSVGGSGGGKGDKPGGDKTPGSGKGKDGGKGGHPGQNTGYNAGIDDAVDALAELPQMVIGAVELLTFFPHHTQWPTWILRLYRNGWSTGAIAKAQLHARGTLDRSRWERRAGALRHQLRTAVINKYGPDNTPSGLASAGRGEFQPFVQHSSGNNVDHYDVRAPVDDTGDWYQPARGQNTHSAPARLQDVINGVVNWPTGNDAGQLTHALRYAQQHGLLQQTTRDLPNLVFARNILVAQEASTTAWDSRGVERLNNAVAYP